MILTAKRNDDCFPSSAVIIKSKSTAKIYENYAIFQFTESNWVLEVRLYQYSNPTSRRINGRCCDIDGVSDGICMNPCDNDFLFCLRVDVTSSSCLYGAYRTGLVAGGDELNFTSVALIGENNVSHPLLFNGTQWPENVSLKNLGYSTVKMIICNTLL